MKKSTNNRLTPTLGKPAPPDFITGEALEEWNRVCGEMDAAGTLTTADRTVLTLYVECWARWLKATEKIQEMGEIIPAPKTGTLMHNPWCAIARDEHKAMVKLLSELGQTPQSRLLIAKNMARAAKADSDDTFPEFDID